MSPIDDPKVAPMEPVVVTSIGTGPGGLLATGTTATTPGNQPNLIVNVVNPLVAMLVRAGYLFVTTLSGLVVAAMTSQQGSKLLYTSDFFTMLVLCASLSVPVTVVGSLKDLATIFGKLEGRFPLLTGNV